LVVVALLVVSAPVAGAASVWSSAGSMATGRRSHAATRLDNGKVLVAGGATQSVRTAGAELYDPTANAWSSAKSMATDRTRHTATLLANGKVLVAGGYGSNGALASAELYDPATGYLGDRGLSSACMPCADREGSRGEPNGGG
jgi:hypothetical protein